MLIVSNNENFMLHLHSIYYNIKGEIRFFFIFPPPIFTHVCQRTPLPVCIRAREGKKKFSVMAVGIAVSGALRCVCACASCVTLRVCAWVCPHGAFWRLNLGDASVYAFWAASAVKSPFPRISAGHVSVFPSPFPCRPGIAVKSCFDNFHHLKRFSAICDKNQCRFHACFRFFRCFVCRISMCFEVKFWNRLETIGFFRTKRQLCVGKFF